MSTNLDPKDFPQTIELVNIVGPLNIKSLLRKNATRVEVRYIEIHDLHTLICKDINTRFIT